MYNSHKMGSLSVVHFDFHNGEIKEFTLVCEITGQQYGSDMYSYRIAYVAEAGREMMDYQDWSTYYDETFLNQFHTALGEWLTTNHKTWSSPVVHNLNRNSELMASAEYETKPEETSCDECDEDYKLVGTEYKCSCC